MYACQQVVKGSPYDVWVLPTTFSINALAMEPGQAPACGRIYPEVGRFFPCPMLLTQNKQERPTLEN